MKTLIIPSETIFNTFKSEKEPNYCLKDSTELNTVLFQNLLISRHGLKRNTFQIPVGDLANGKIKSRLSYRL